MAEAVSRRYMMMTQAEMDRLCALALSALSYDPLTGILTWKTRRAQRIKVGDVAGSLNKMDGYVHVSLENRLHRAHRLIWLMAYGSFPVQDIDHANGDRSDNRLANLRLATNQQNCVNGPSRRGRGLKGASRKTSSKRWVARLCGRYLGIFETEVEAHAAYVAAANAQFGDFARAS